MNTQLDNTAISKVLGQRVSAPSTYDKNILVREPRQSNRTYLNITDDKLPFTGYDIWNNWEISALTNNGLPVTGIAKIIYPCDSKYIVESKSAKLYFNSFNMTEFGETPEQVYKNIEETSANDLSEFLQTTVNVKVFPALYAGYEQHEYTLSKAHNYFRSFELLDTKYPDIITRQYTEDQTLLKYTEQQVTLLETPQKFRSSLLRSNCRVTSQPDAGDVYIHLLSEKTVDPESLLKYIISFRNECHFHEEICECIYTRLNEVFTPKELMVACFYVRRGSLDINPVRTSNPTLLPPGLIDPEQPFIKSLRQ